MYSKLHWYTYHSTGTRTTPLVHVPLHWYMYQSIGVFPLPPSGTTLTFRFCRRHLGLIESLPWKDGGQQEKIKRRPWIRGSCWKVMFGMEDGGRPTADDMDGWTCCKGGEDIRQPCSDELELWFSTTMERNKGK
ncbi:unnamed protein product [Linum trigynum]|uniref:Uncharacterized protein n=1 Tax=Linum trigynum TaxID=586398 RepID=A0AAV2CFE0_9ROSI